MARQLHADNKNTIADVCTMLGISRATLYRYLELGKTKRELKEGASDG